MAPRKRSLVWTYFKLLDDKTVQCLLCTVCVVHNGPTTTNMMRHLRSKHPDEVANAGGDDRKSHGAEMTDSDDHTMNSGDFCSVEVEMDDDDETAPITTVDDAAITSAINGILEAAEGVAVRKGASKDGISLRNRSSVWKHYKRLETPTSSLCLLCMQEIKHYNSTSNLKRHLSKKHPEAFAGLGGIINEQSSKTIQQKPVQNTPRSSTRVVKENRTDVFDVSRERREEEISELGRVRELIEAVRNAQKQEARALEHQRELLEMLRDGNARELAAERERIESLRKAQEKESIALDRQREELQKEKEELQKQKEELQLKWGQLEQKKESCTCQQEDIQ